MTQYLEMESQRVQKYSAKFSLQHTVDLSIELNKAIRKLSGKGIYTLADLEKALGDLREKVDGARSIVTAKERRMKELEKLIDSGQQYLDTDPIRKEHNRIRFKKRQEKFEEDHHAELALWQAANRFLHAKNVDVSALPEGIKAWKAELAALTAEHDEKYEKLKAYRKDVNELDDVHRKAQKVIAAEQKRQKERKDTREVG